MAKKTDKSKPSPRQNADNCSSCDDSHDTAELQALINERDDLNNRYQRALADYQNTQRRFSSDLKAARQTGIEQVVAEILPVLDHFDMALKQDTSQLTVEQLVHGIDIIRQELTKALAACDVRQISPAPDDPFDPSEHEALSQVAVDGITAGHISSLYQPGYAIGDRVIRPAKVTIAPGEPANSSDESAHVFSEE